MIAAGALAFVFDLDGTLIDCRERQVAVARAAVIDLGENGFDADAFWSAKRSGKTTRDALHDLLGPDRADVAARAWIAAVEDAAWLAVDRPLPGAEAALARARDAGYAPVVLTARRDAEVVREQVERLGWTDALEDLMVVDPAHAAEEKADRLSALRPRGFVGDTESDADAAQRSRTPFAALGTGQRDPEFLAAQGITRVYDCLSAAVESLLG